MRSGSYASASEALEALQTAQAPNDPFHFVIADYQMPGIDGASLATVVRANPSMRDVVFIMLTSVGNCRQFGGATAGRIDACLVKPVRNSRLMDTLVTIWSKEVACRFAVERNGACNGIGIRDKSAVSDLGGEFGATSGRSLTP